MKYGYIRVSAKEQNERRQLIALQEFGIANGLKKYTLLSVLKLTRIFNSQYITAGIF